MIEVGSARGLQRWRRVRGDKNRATASQNKFRQVRILGQIADMFLHIVLINGGRNAEYQLKSRAVGTKNSMFCLCANLTLAEVDR